MPSWTLEYDSTEQTLEAWSIANARVRFENNGIDVLTLEVVDDWDGTDLFDDGETLILRRNRTGSGTTWTGGSIVFRGEVRQTPAI